MNKFRISRRQFLRLTAASSGAALLAACGAQATPEPTIAPTSAPVSSGEAGGADVEIIAKDVIDFALESDAWTGQYGFVTFQLQEGLYSGESIYFIRTDASDADYAAENGLVHVPLLITGREIAGSVYFFSDGRLPVLSTSPANEDFVSLFQVKQVTIGGGDLTLDSAEAVEQALADRRIRIDEPDIFVNFPVVKWSGGELAVDADKTETLGGGQLTEPIDVDNMTVTFKLHQCFPGSRYILTDTSKRWHGSDDERARFCAHTSVDERGRY